MDIHRSVLKPTLALPVVPCSTNSTKQRIARMSGNHHRNHKMAISSSFIRPQRGLEDSKGHGFGLCAEWKAKVIFFHFSHSLEFSSTYFDSTCKNILELCYLKPVKEAFETMPFFHIRSLSIQSKGQEKGKKLASCHTEILIGGM